MNQHLAHQRYKLVMDKVEAMILLVQEMGAGWMWSGIQDGKHRVVVNEDPDLRPVMRSQLP